MYVQSRPELLVGISSGVCECARGDHTVLTSIVASSQGTEMPLFDTF